MSENNYWNECGKYQHEYDALSELIPTSGKAETLHIEAIRCISRVYYDRYNNGHINNDNFGSIYGYLKWYAEELKNWNSGRMGTFLSWVELLEKSPKKVSDKILEEMTDTVIYHANKIEYRSK